MDVSDTRCSMASYSNSMSVPIIVHTLLFKDRVFSTYIASGVIDVSTYRACSLRVNELDALGDDAATVETRAHYWREFPKWA